MALIRFAEGQQRSGAIGASVYSHNRFGAYIRSRSIPVNPNSTAQALIRASMLAAQAAWQDLAEVNRALWEGYADSVSWKNRFGDTVKLTDQQHFLRVAALARYVGLGANFDNPPSEMRLPAPDETVTASAPAGGPAVAIAFGAATDAWKAAAGNYLLVFIGRERGPKVNYYGGPYRYMGKVQGASTPPTSPQSMNSPFGDFMAEGGKVFGYTRSLINGIGLSEPKFFSLTLAEPV